MDRVGKKMRLWHTVLMHLTLIFKQLKKIVKIWVKNPVNGIFNMFIYVTGVTSCHLTTNNWRLMIQNWHKKKRGYYLKSIILLLLWLFPTVVSAQFYDVETTGEYVMGDNDTKVEARRMALEHAKRLAVEQIGTYLESETIVKNGQLTKDEIRIYTSAIIKTSVLFENINLLENKTTIFKIHIKASVDVNVLEKKIKEIEADTKRKEQIALLQVENIRLIKELENLSSLLKDGKIIEYKRLREERENILEKLEKNQNSIIVAFEKGTLLNLALESKTQLEISKKNIDNALQFIADNTEITLGEPRVRHKGEVADLLIDLRWRIKRLDEVIRKIKWFHYSPKIHKDILGQYIDVSSFYNSQEQLGDYFYSKRIRIDVKAGKNRVVKVEDKEWLLGGAIESKILIKARNNDIDGIGKDKILIERSLQLYFENIPINELTEITNIEAKVVVE